MSKHSGSKYWLFVAAFLCVTLLTIMKSQDGVRAVNSESLAATYSRGTLHVSIPHREAHAGAGRLTIEILNPEDEVVAHSERRIDAENNAGWWTEDLKFAKALTVEDVMWHRLRYRFTYEDPKQPEFQGIESVSQILHTPIL